MEKTYENSSDNLGIVVQKVTTMRINPGEFQLQPRDCSAEGQKRWINLGSLIGGGDSWENLGIVVPKVKMCENLGSFASEEEILGRRILASTSPCGPVTPTRNTYFNSGESICHM